MKKVSIITALVMALTVLTASVAVAGGPTCEDFGGTGWDNHGTHVTNDYATPGEPGGANGGPAHFGEHPIGASPGATFCQTGNGDNQAPEVLVQPGGNVIIHPGQ